LNSLPIIQSFHHAASHTVTHVISDRTTRCAAIIDSVLDYHAPTGQIRTDSADQVLAYVCEERLQVDWHLETHRHADHLSAAAYLKDWTGGLIATGVGMHKAPDLFRRIFEITPAETWGEPLVVDRFLDDGDTLMLGQLPIQVLHTPGHTPTCVSYRIGMDVFAGDTLLMPDHGTARCDWQGGDAGALYRSIQRLFQLPPHTRLHLGHDSRAGQRVPVATVAEQRAHNVHVRDGVSEANFIDLNQHRRPPPSLSA
jgi:glyoxylase-like metal-dependent hydrolase (beta-lactamase superfamily II)